MWNFTTWFEAIICTQKNRLSDVTLIDFFIWSGFHQGICRPIIDHPGPTEGHTSVECAPHEGSEVEASLYELVWSGGQRNPDAGEPDYESDESLDGLVDDLPEQQGKVCYDIVNMVGATWPLLLI